MIIFVCDKSPFMCKDLLCRPILIMSKASLNIHVWPYVSFALGKYLGVELLAHCASLYLTFWEAAKQ